MKKVLSVLLAVLLIASSLTCLSGLSVFAVDFEGDPVYANDVQKTIEGSIDTSSLQERGIVWTTFDTVNLADYDFLEFDVYMASESDDAQGFDLFVSDHNNNTSRNVSFRNMAVNEWHHIVMGASDFTFDDNCDHADVYALGTENDPTWGYTTQIENIAFTNFATPDMNNTYNLGKALNFKLNYYGNDPWATKSRFGESVNFANYDYLEMDIYPTTASVRLYFLDSTNKNANEGRGFYDITGLTTNTWNHVVFGATAFNTGYGMNGKIGDVVAFIADNFGTEVHIANAALTTIAPAMHNTYNFVKAINYRLNYTGSDPWATKASIGEVVNLNDYDYIEFDYMNNTSSLRFYMVDTANGRGFYDVYGTANEWHHVVMPASAFDTGWGLNGNKTIVNSFMAERGTEIHIANMAFTTATPAAEYTYTFAKAINYKLNYTGSDPWATWKRIGESVNLNNYDYIEMDVYAPDTGVRLCFCDSTCTGVNEGRGFHDITGLTPNTWNHVVFRADDFDTGWGMNGNKADATGFMINAGGGEYHIANVAFTNFAPEAEYTYTLAKELNYKLNYTGSDPWATWKRMGESVNLNDYDYIEMDVYAPDTGVRLCFCDSTCTGVNEGRGFHDITGLTPNTWNHVVFKSTDFDTGYGMNGNKADVTGFMINAGGGEYHIANVALTNFAPLPEYTYNLVKELNFKLNYSGNDAWATKTYFGETVNLNNYEYIEMDVYAPASTVRLFFLDSTNKNANEGRGFHDITGLTVNAWNHVVFGATDFNTSYGMDGNKADAVAFMADVNGEIHIANVAFTKSAPNPEYTYYLKKAFDNCKLDYKGGDAWATKKYFGETVNLNNYEYIEFDVYATSSSVRFYFLDSTNRNANEGRGFHDCPITANKWNHVVFSATDFNTGYDMNGNKADVVAFIADNFGSEVHIANFAFTTTEEPEEPVVSTVWGDANGDEVIDVRDYVQIKRYVELEAEYEDSFAIFDIDGDFAITEDDLDLVLQYILGCIDTLDPEVLFA